MMSKLGPNMKTLPLVIGSNYPRAKEVGEPWKELPLILIYLDTKRFGMSLSELLVNVFQANDNVEGPKLIGQGSDGYKTYVRQSFYNQNYGHTLINGIKYPSIAYATENVYEKLPKALSKLNRNPKYSQEIADFMKRKCSAILSMLFSPYFLDVDKYFGKYTWKYDSHTMNSITQDDVRKDASAGVYFSKTQSYTNVETGKTYRIGNRHATKGEVAQTVGENIDRIFTEFLKGHDVDMPASFTRAATKAEPFATFGKDTDEILKLFNKVRIFHICDTFSYLASMSVDYLRVHIEKGNMIKIGMNWYRGGAYHIAKYMHYLKKMIYGTGDVTGLDLSLLAPLISLYYAAGVNYYDLKSFTVEMRALFLWIRKNVSIHLSQHLSQLFGSLLVWLNGMIASGHYLTSHADSWCMAFLFVAFIFWTIEKYPNITEDVMAAIRDGLLCAIFYGDDDLLSCLEHIAPVLGKKAFCVFLSLWGITSRDVVEYKHFLSRLDINGSFIYEGPVFLKVHFIDRSTVVNYVSKDTYDILPPVLPYRSNVMGKLAAVDGSFQNPGTVLISTLGLAEVTYGTNVWAYHSLSVIFFRVRSQLSIGWYDDLKKQYAMKKDLRSLNKLVKGFGGFDPSNVTFPTLNSLLLKHKYADVHGLRTDYAPFVTKL